MIYILFWSNKEIIGGALGRWPCETKMQRKRKVVFCVWLNDHGGMLKVPLISNNETSSYTFIEYITNSLLLQDNCTGSIFIIMKSWCWMLLYEYYIYIYMPSVNFAIFVGTTDIALLLRIWRSCISFCIRRCYMMLGLYCCNKIFFHLEWIRKTGNGNFHCRVEILVTWHGNFHGVWIQSCLIFKLASSFCIF